MSIIIRHASMPAFQIFVLEKYSLISPENGALIACKRFEGCFDKKKAMHAWPTCKGHMRFI